jgi:hypothetical protein
MLTLAAVLSHTAASAEAKAAAALPQGSWRFIVSGDSRNCGDVVMPTIAAHSAQFAPAFYWHLGDLRAIFKIDEDMAAASHKKGEALSCETYRRLAWPDFTENQIAPFGDLPFYLGIGNHEVMPPKNTEAFKREFFEWLDLPALHRQRDIDREPGTPQTYFHWIQGGVDFLYLDNAQGFFSEDQLTWFFRRLQSARYNSSVKSLVVGMHEALPDSIANNHSMGDSDDPRGRATGEMVYKAVASFQEKSKKPVYLLASHSHFYMENIFDTAKLKENGAKPLPGWITGSGGAVRYKLPDGAPPSAKTEVYGYLVGTVSASGTIEFAFEEVHESDVPTYVRQRYPDTLIPWCFARNSQIKDPHDPDPTCP